MCTGAYLCFLSCLATAAVAAGDLNVFTGVRAGTPWANLLVAGSRGASAGQYAVAAAAYEAAISAITGDSREDRLDLALALGGLGSCDAKLGKYGEAEPLHRRALALWRELLPGGLMVAVALNNLADADIARGDFEEARKSQEEAEHADEAALGRMDAMVANDWNNLGVTYTLQRRYSAAEKALLRAIEIGESLTPLHPKLTEFNGNLASLMLELDRPNEAEQLQRRVLSLQVKERGRTHLSVALTLVHIADCEIKLKRFASAVGHASEAIRILKDRLGERNARMGSAYFELAIAYQRLRRADLAEPAIEWVMEIDKESTVRPSARSAHMREYAVVLRNRGKKDEAKTAEASAVLIEQQNIETIASRETVDIKALRMRP